VIFSTGEQFEISFGEQRAVIVEVGGGVRSYAVGGRELIDGYPVEEMCHSGRGQVLIPWPNRIEDGVYEFDGQSRQLPLTEPTKRNAIHGLVRWVAWTVKEHTSDRVVMEHVLHPQPGYPHLLALTIDYALSSEGLRVRTTATNVGPEACPFGSGAHPYLTPRRGPIDPLVLTVPARSVLEKDARGMPSGAAPAAGLFDFRRPRPIGDTVLDDCFTDLDRSADGRARVVLIDPEDGLELTLWVDESYPYLMLFTGDPLPDVNRRSLAVEPMTCPPNAFRSGDGLLRLEPGASTTGTWGISAGTVLDS
jgi:aldose 1-epimerase